MRRSGLSYASIEINLLLWMVTLGALLGGEFVAAGYVAGVGFVFAMIAQHWGYYRLRSAAKDRQKGE